MKCILLLVYGHESRGGDASLRERFEDDRGVEPGESGAAELGVAVDGAEPELGHLLQDVHGEGLLKRNMTCDWVLL